jgi:hypothetical protein
MRMHNGKNYTNMRYLQRGEIRYHAGKSFEDAKRDGVSKSGDTITLRRDENGKDITYVVRVNGKMLDEFVKFSNAEKLYKHLLTQ